MSTEVINGIIRGFQNSMLFLTVTSGLDYVGDRSINHPRGIALGSTGFAIGEAFAYPSERTVVSPYTVFGSLIGALPPTVVGLSLLTYDISLILLSQKQYSMHSSPSQAVTLPVSLEMRYLNHSSREYPLRRSNPLQDQ